MTDDEGPQDFSEPNGDRELRFTGHLLGEATSFTDGKDRWFEIRIYKTVGGNYVVCGAGCSTRPGEDHRTWASICEAPEAVVEKLHLYDSRGTKYLPRTSEHALVDACAVDDPLSRVFMVQTVD